MKSVAIISYIGVSYQLVLIGRTAKMGNVVRGYRYRELPLSALVW